MNGDSLVHEVDTHFHISLIELNIYLEFAGAVSIHPKNRFSNVALPPPSLLIHDSH